MKHMLGLDCGNSSFRIFLGRFDGERITMEMIQQTPNAMVQVGGLFYWDLLNIFEGFKGALRKAAAQVHVDSIGVCTWGIDFALYTREGHMLGNPLAYRNAIGAEFLDRLGEEERARLFDMTGILCDRINSVYLLQGMREKMPSLYLAADKLLMIPDILNYMLTGVMQNEPSELSTTQLMDARSRQVSQEACRAFDISPSLFSPVGVHGRLVGKLTQSLLAELEIGYDIPVVCVPSHDTACASLAVPAAREDFAFISSGTWSLIGTELAEPLITPQALASSLTNEVGAFGRITLLKNNAGLFLMQRLRQEYQRALGREAEWDELVGLAQASSQAPVFDVNEGRFFNPASMSRAIWDALLESGQASGDLDWPVVLRSVYESLAHSYANCVERLEEVTGKRFDKIYILGGGARNAFLNGLTARRTGRKVVACDGESTVLGNIAAQIAYFQPEATPERLREIIGRSIHTQVFE